MTIHETHKQGMEEFSKKYLRLDGKWKLSANGRFNNEPQTLKSHITSQEIAILKAVEEWVEKEMESENSLDYDFGGETPQDRKHNEIRGMDKIFGHNQALEDLISHLKEQIKLIQG